MATYAFIQPVLAGKIDVWKQYIDEVFGPLRAAHESSRKRVGLTKEQVWLQNTPMGDFAVVYWEAPDIGKVFEGFMTSQDPYDVWFREKVLEEIHGMDSSQPLPEPNEQVFDYQA